MNDTLNEMEGWQIIAGLVALALLAFAVLHGIAAIISALVPW